MRIFFSNFHMFYLKNDHFWSENEILHLLIQYRKANLYDLMKWQKVQTLLKYINIVINKQ